MRPSSVEEPVATATPCPVPAATSVPACTRFCRSAKGVDGRNRRRPLVDGSRLAGERGLLGSQPLRFEQPNVGADTLSLADRNHVARHELLGGQLDPVPVAPDTGRLGDQLRQRSDRSTRPNSWTKPIKAFSTTTASTTTPSSISPNANATAADATSAYISGLVTCSTSNAKRRRALGDRQPVGAMADEPRASFVRAEPLSVRSEALQHVRLRPGMPRPRRLGPDPIVAGRDA